MNKDLIINQIISVEGGYINDPDDSGGETNFGITKKVAVAYGYTGEMHDMPRNIAFDIYSAKYWHAVRADSIMSMSEVIAEEVVDTAVNMGPARAGKFLQRALNALNRRGKLYADISVDGVIGRGTLGALQAYLAVRDDHTLAKMLNCLQGSFYVVLVERREKDEEFIYGWLKNRVKL